jgi:glycerol uptake operon antiterminator
MHEKIIASITNGKSLDTALNSNVKRVNLVAGSIQQLRAVIDKCHAADKRVFVHIEMLQGTGRDAAFIQYLAEHFKPDGIISTRSNLIQAAKQAGLQTIQRIFAIDTAALETAVKMVKTGNPDEVELMPGLMPRIIREVKSKIDRPLIVGGLVRHREEISVAFANGADFVSMGNEQLWC